MSDTWRIDRQDVIEAAVACYRRGWSDSLEDACAAMLRYHYIGISPNHAKPHLIRDAYDLLFSKYQGRTQKQQKISDMAQTLKTEGWRTIYNHLGWLWIHKRTHITPSPNGGTFSTFAQATEFVYHSETRQIVRSRT
jgi:hypothetical protein